MPVVQAFTQEDQERQRFAKATDESLMADLKNAPLQNRASGGATTDGERDRSRNLVWASARWRAR